MCDKLVFDLAQEIEGSPNIFIRKDWLNILDNQAQNYNSNQSVIDTSQLSNSNKWMNYREAYLSMPFLITLGTAGDPVQTPTASGTSAFFTPASITNYPGNVLNPRLQTGSDYSIGLKNWYGSIIHSFTLDYNGTTIIQQTPFINLWNNFRLMTSLSWNDVQTQGTIIGFYPDTSTTFTFTPTNVVTPFTTYDNTLLNGQGTCNNMVNMINGVSSSINCNNFDIGSTNNGLKKRIQNINFDLDGLTNVDSSFANSIRFNNFITGGQNVNGSPSTNGTMANLWKSYISNKKNQVTGGTVGVVQYSIVATIYLKHIHNFFNMVPLLKGTFMKMTINLNNTSVNFFTTNETANVAGDLGLPTSIGCTSVTTPFGGCNPLMISSAATYSSTNIPTTAGPDNYNYLTTYSGSIGLFPQAISTGTAFVQQQNYILNLSVGATCLNSTLASSTNVATGALSRSVYLYVPAYTFNSPFEQAYLSQSVKTIKYTDVYQFQVLNVAPNGQFNNLITNGIANIKSVLVLPFFSSASSNGTTTPAYLGVALSNNSGFLSGLPVWQSPFDPAGGGPTSPMCYLTNFNVQIAGQNAIYNTQRWLFEEFNNQLYGCNSVNGGLTDGLTSGLIGRQEFDMEYCYYYVNVERMLPVEETVPKSVNILGTNASGFALDLIVFIEYGNEIKIDPLTGARV